MYMALACKSDDEMKLLMERFASIDGVRAEEKKSDVLDHCLSIIYAHDKYDEFYSTLASLGIDQNEIHRRMAIHLKLLKDSLE